MQTIDETKKRLAELLSERESLLKLARGKNQEILTFGSHYQVWYTKTIKLVELLGRDRLNEFVSYYMADPKRKSVTGETFTIQDFVRGLGPAPNAFGKVLFDAHDVVMIRLHNQFQILAALNTRIDSVFADVKGHLLAELQDSELHAAAKLAKINSRAAGALAGVVLERHLQRVAENHQVAIAKKDPTIGDLNEPLKAEGVYDVPTWRKIQLLADLRNLCAHSKSAEPTDAQAAELLSGVSAIVKSVF